jgi:hypothetical protein
MYYLVNATVNQRLSIAGKALRPGEQLNFPGLTAEIKLALDRGDVLAYNGDTDLQEVFAGYTISEQLTALDPAVAAGLPPHLRSPVISYALVAPAPPADPLSLYVPDSALRTVLNDRLGIFKAAELAFFARPMRLIALGLTDARGLEAATHVPELDLSSNAITTIGDLSKMKQLSVLDLSSNDLNTVVGLSGLKTLKEVRLQGNNLTSIGSVHRLTSLAELDIRSNLFGQTAIDNLIAELWQFRYELGRRNALIRLENNAPPSALSIQKIEGTGAYDFEGLKQMGCVVTYDAT